MIRPPALYTSLILLVACTSGGEGSEGTKGPIIGTGALEIVSCQSNQKSPHTLTEVLHTSVQGLDPKTQASRTGQETNVRVHPDGNRIVFARQRKIRDGGRERL